MKFAVQFLLVSVCIVLYAIFLYYFPPRPVVDSYVSQNAITDLQQYTDLNAFSNRVKKCDIGRLLHEVVRNYGRPSVPGFIYMYHLDSDPADLIKVGRTKAAVGVNQRLKEWSTKCKKRLKLIKKWYCSDHERAESIIHNELKSNGLWFGNRQCTCGETHTEFFQANIDTLMECCQFWTDFLNSGE
jgi:hypothetical protein